MLGLAPSLGCPPNNITCLCTNMDFGNGVRDCTNESCPGDADKQSIISVGSSFCGCKFLSPFPLPLPFPLTRLGTAALQAAGGESGTTTATATESSGTTTVSEGGSGAGGAVITTTDSAGSTFTTAAPTSSGGLGGTNGTSAGVAGASGASGSAASGASSLVRLSFYFFSLEQSLINHSRPVLLVPPALLPAPADRPRAQLVKVPAAQHPPPVTPHPPLARPHLLPLEAPPTRPESHALPVSPVSPLPSSCKVRFRVNTDRLPGNRLSLLAPASGFRF